VRDQGEEVVDDNLDAEGNERGCLAEKKFAGKRGKITCLLGNNPNVLLVEGCRPRKGVFRALETPEWGDKCAHLGASVGLWIRDQKAIRP